MISTKVNPKESAKQALGELLESIRTLSGRPGKRMARAFVAELHSAYKEANFGGDGDYNTSLDEADLCKVIADLVSRDWGFPIKTHDQLEREAHGGDCKCSRCSE